MANMTGASSTRVYLVPSDLAGERVDRILSRLAPDLSRSAAQRLLKDGCVLLDGSVSRASERPRAGQALLIRIPPPRGLDLAPEQIPLDVIYEDGDLLVVNKPPDMVVHPAKGHQDGTLVNALLAHCALPGVGESARPGIVHRLDQYTSGLLLVAKDEAAHQALTRQVEQREVKRVYHALVWGRPQPEEAAITTSFGRHPQHRTMMAVLPPGKGRRAVTEYRQLQAYCWSWRERPDERPRGREAALLECVLQTGRTHQIRVHLAHLGCPILADPLYGDPVRDESGPESLRRLIAALPGQALHAARLAFAHPRSGNRICLEAEPPAAFSAVLRWLRTNICHL